MPRIRRYQIILTLTAVLGVILLVFVYRKANDRSKELCGFENIEISFFDEDVRTNNPCDTDEFTIYLIAMGVSLVVILVSLTAVVLLYHGERRAAAGERPPHAPTFLPAFVRRIIDRIIHDAQG